MQYASIISPSADEYPFAFSLQCANCRHPLLGTEKFCPNCGRRLTKRPTTIFKNDLVRLLNSLATEDHEPQDNPPANPSPTTSPSSPSNIQGITTIMLCDQDPISCEYLTTHNLCKKATYNAPFPKKCVFSV